MNSSPNPFSYQEKGNKIYVSKVPHFIREGFRACPGFNSGVSYFTLVLTLLIQTNILFSQQEDSLFIYPDSILTISDSLQTEKPAGKTYDVDTTVYASSKDSLIFFVKDKKMKIYGEANINYKQTEIKSANIFIDFNNNDIDAVGVPSDSLPEKLIGAPVLKEGTEVYTGKTMKYNFKSGRGLLSLVKTEMDGAYYTGNKINKVDKETYFIEDGIFTTCDDSTCPHYHFTASKMKVIHKQQLVAEWIFINFGGVPLPIPLPFAVFPIESGRRSGIIPPTFGSDATFGTYFSRFGYFWAINDYMDLNMTADYYTRGSYKMDTDLDTQNDTIIPVMLKAVTAITFKVKRLMQTELKILNGVYGGITIKA